MTTALRPDGGPVAIGRVSVTSPGLRGKVAVLPPGAADTRGAAAADSGVAGAFAATGLREQRTIVISEYAVDSAAVRGGASRAPRPGGPGLTVTVPGPGTGMGQVLLAADEDGSLSWVFPDRTAPGGPATRGDDMRTYRVPVTTPAASRGQAAGQRGLIAAVGKKVLKVLAFELLKKTAEEVADSFAARWEQRHHPYRLRAFEPARYRDPAAAGLTMADLAAYQPGPVLLLLHGEMNLSHSGFGQLPLLVVQRLYSRYQGRVLALDHPTVSATPAANAAWLSEMLPAGELTVDILAHSRGGLVARALTEQPTTDRLRVRRLVMVGTPNQGTALADPAKLDHFLDLVTTALDFVPDIPVIEVLNIVISVVKQIAVGAYYGLDGLTVMKPGSPWLAEINKRRPAAATYHAISSDYQLAPVASIGRSTLDRVTGLVFKHAGNDLVVPEAGVYAENGAYAFPVPDPLVLKGAQSVDHFNYWSSPAVHDKLDQWLVP